MAYGEGYGNPEEYENPEASGMVLDEMSEFGEQMLGDEMAQDFTENKADPKNIPGVDPSEPGVEFSEEELMELEAGLGGSEELEVEI